jgi:uncharacterized protein YjiS (DUF1127 family)
MVIMTVWLDAIALAAGVPAASDHRPTHPAPAKARRAGATRRLARGILSDIRGAVPLHAFAGPRRWHKRRKAIAELGALDDRMLKDIGIGRGDIRGLVDAQLRHEAEAHRPARARPVFGLTARPCAQPC